MGPITTATSVFSSQAISRRSYRSTKGMMSASEVEIYSGEFARIRIPAEMATFERV